MKLELGKIIIEDITEDDPEKKKGEYYFIKKLEIESITYPGIEIEQLDLCADGSETFDVWINICAHMTKDELFEFLKTANSRTASMLSRKDDQFPGKITIELFPKLEETNQKKY